MQVELPSAKRFTQDRGETIPTSIWSDFETIVLSMVMDNVKNEEVVTVVKLYNDIVYYIIKRLYSVTSPYHMS